MTPVLGRLREAASRLALRGRAVLVAVSGGIDSTVLADALHETSHELSLRLSIGHVNHGLRSGADADEAGVRELTARLGVPFRAIRVDPEALRQDCSSRARPTLQEAARRARYDALGSLARDFGADVLATAHTADDQAETVLLRVLRGTGPAGLAGIPERSPDGSVVRPLLRVFRDEVETYARSRGLKWREDPSNRSERFARSRLRTRWLPGLATEFNPQLLRALAELAEAQGRDEAWIQTEVAREAVARLVEEGEGLWIETKDWESLPEALAWRLVRQAMHRLGAGRDVSRVHLARASEFLATAGAGRRLELPSGLELRCHGVRFRLARRKC
jgi:tRNA(Ile)-lysidine synthase